MKDKVLIVVIVFAMAFSFTACDEPENNVGGKTWIAVPDNTFGSNMVNSVAWGDGVFIAVGAGGKMARSTDGISWTSVPDNTFNTNEIHCVTWGDGKFFAGGAGGRMAYSDDNGISWTAVSNSTFGSNEVYGITWGNDKWVAVGRSRMAYSDNAGTSWTGESSNEPFTNVQGAPVLRDVVFGNGRFVLVGAAGGQGHGSSLAHSANGINWTARDMDDLVLSAITSVCFGNGKFTAVSTDTIIYSDDGMEWTDAQGIPSILPTNRQLQSVAAGAGKFTAVGTNNAVLTSENGVNWISVIVSLNSHFYDVAYGNSTWVAVGLNGVIAYFLE